MAIAKFREYYLKKGINEQNIYEGIFDIIKGLHDDNRIVAVATSKPTHLAEIVLERYGVLEYLSPIVGSNIDGTMTSKIEILD